MEGVIIGLIYRDSKSPTGVSPAPIPGITAGALWSVFLFSTRGQWRAGAGPLDLDWVWECGSCRELASGHCLGRGRGLFKVPASQPPPASSPPPPAQGSQGLEGDMQEQVITPQELKMGWGGTRGPEPPRSQSFGGLQPRVPIPGLVNLLVNTFI